jgi:hypothetical protein
MFPIWSFCNNLGAQVTDLLHNRRRLDAYHFEHLFDILLTACAQGPDMDRGGKKATLQIVSLPRWDDQSLEAARPPLTVSGHIVGGVSRNWWDHAAMLTVTSGRPTGSNR